jgi:hypothetical protein
VGEMGMPRGDQRKCPNAKNEAKKVGTGPKAAGMEGPTDGHHSLQTDGDDEPVVDKSGNEWIRIKKKKRPWGRICLIHKYSCPIPLIYSIPFLSFPINPISGHLCQKDIAYGLLASIHSIVHSIKILHSVRLPWLPFPPLFYSEFDKYLYLFFLANCLFILLGFCSPGKYIGLAKARKGTNYNNIIAAFPPPFPSPPLLTMPRRMRTC